MRIEPAGEYRSQPDNFIDHLGKKGMKFVIHTQEATDVAHLFPTVETHRDIALQTGTKETFQGAGRCFTVSGNAYWDSLTCIEEFGKDSPANPKVADRMLADLRKCIQHLLQQKNAGSV